MIGRCCQKGSPGVSTTQDPWAEWPTRGIPAIKRHQSRRRIKQHQSTRLRQTATVLPVFLFLVLLLHLVLFTSFGFVSLFLLERPPNVKPALSGLKMHGPERVGPKLNQSGFQVCWCGHQMLNGQQDSFQRGAFNVESLYKLEFLRPGRDRTTRLLPRGTRHGTEQ